MHYRGGEKFSEAYEYKSLFRREHCDGCYFIFMKCTHTPQKIKRLLYYGFFFDRYHRNIQISILKKFRPTFTAKSRNVIHCWRPAPGMPRSGSCTINDFVFRWFILPFEQPRWIRVRITKLKFWLLAMTYNKMNWNTLVKHFRKAWAKYGSINKKKLNLVFRDRIFLNYLSIPLLWVMYVLHYNIVERRHSLYQLFISTSSS